MQFANYLHVDTLLSHDKMSLAGRSGRAPSKGISPLRQWVEWSLNERFSLSIKPQRTSNFYMTKWDKSNLIHEK